MEIAVLDFDFDRISRTTLVNAGEAGHFNIHIHSSPLGRERTLNVYFERETARNQGYMAIWLYII